MPFVSQKQRAWMWANKPKMAEEWEGHTPKGKKLPEKVKQAFVMYESALREIAALTKEALYDPAIHNTPEALDRLRRMEKLQLQHRIRTSGIPVNEVGFSDAVKMVKKNPYLSKGILTGHFTASHGLETTPFSFGPMKPEVYIPNAGTRQVLPATIGIGAAPKGSHRLLTHHELDEANTLLGKMGRGIGNVGGEAERMQWGPSLGSNIEKSTPNIIRGPANRMAQEVTGRMGEAGDLLRNVAQLPQSTTSIHNDPSVLIQESNRAFMMDPASKSRMVKLRNAMGETDLLRRHGLRYGEEYIPEEGARFAKMRAGISGEVGKQQEAAENVFKGSKRLLEKYPSPVSVLKKGVKGELSRVKSLALRIAKR